MKTLKELKAEIKATLNIELELELSARDETIHKTADVTIRVNERLSTGYINRYAEELTVYLSASQDEETHTYVVDMAWDTELETMRVTDYTYLGEEKCMFQVSDADISKLIEGSTEGDVVYRIETADGRGMLAGSSSSWGVTYTDIPAPAIELSAAAELLEYRFAFNSIDQMVESCAYLPVTLVQAGVVRIKAYTYTSIKSDGTQCVFK